MRHACRPVLNCIPLRTGRPSATSTTDDTATAAQKTVSIIPAVSAASATLAARGSDDEINTTSSDKYALIDRYRTAANARKGSNRMRSSTVMWRRKNPYAAAAEGSAGTGRDNSPGILTPDFHHP